METLQRIYIAAPHIPPHFSGSGNFSLQQAKYFARSGYEVTLLTFTSTASDVPNLTIDVVAESGWYHEDGHRIFRNGALLMELYRKIRGEGAVLHCMSPATWFGMLSMVAAKLRSIPVSFEPNLLGANDLVTIQESRMGALKSAILKSADAEVCMSPALAERSRAAGMNSGKQYMIPNPVDISVFTPISSQEKERLRMKLGLGRFDDVLLFVGAIRDRKGVKDLIDGFAQLSRDRENCALALVGPTDKDEANTRYASQMRGVVASYGLEERVLFTGRVHNVSEWMQASDVFVFGSKAEGLPSVLLEAMSSGLPVVTYSMPQVTDYVISSGEDGFIVTHQDEFCEQVVSLLENPRTAAEIGVRARERAVRDYDERVVMQKYIDLFHQLSTS